MINRYQKKDITFADSVIKYYLKNDISRQSPNIKDVATVNESGEKCKMPERHLNYGIKEVLQHVLRKYWSDTNKTF